MVQSVLLSQTLFGRFIIFDRKYSMFDAVEIKSDQHKEQLNQRYETSSDRAFFFNLFEEVSWIRCVCTLHVTERKS